MIITIALIETKMSHIATIDKAIASASTCINLYYYNIGTEGAKYLANILSNNSTITYLYLGYNNIGDEGAKYLAEMLCHNSTITSLDVDFNSIGVEATEYIEKFKARNKNYQNYKGSFKSFINKSALPEELYNIIKGFVLLHCYNDVV